MEITRSEQLFTNSSDSGDSVKKGEAGEQDQEVWKLVLTVIGIILGVLILMYLIR